MSEDSVELLSKKGVQSSVFSSFNIASLLAEAKLLEICLFTLTEGFISIFLEKSVICFFSKFC